MLSVCIIDDEQDARILLREMLKEFAPDWRIIGEANSAETAVELLKTTQPDAVFLDIDLKDGTGFDVLTALPPPQYSIIFATAFNQFAIKAFQFNALDYILKPIEVNDLKRVVNKIKKGQSKNDFQQQISTLLASNKNKKIEKLVLNTTEGMYFLPIKEVLRLESSGNYTTIQTISGERIVVSTNLGNFDYLTSEFDPSESFFRIHQSHIIRVSSVRKIQKISDGEFIVLENGDTIPIARRRKEAFLAMMEH
ncbi:MAG: response regulator transcription factor [Saprospiraceae bacterium]|nr:response regulator transcription factor [Saprospiraceae bacterium]